MYFSSFCFLIPIVLLNLPPYIAVSIIGLTISSFTYHNVSNKITKFIDYANIINLCSNVYFENYYYSFLFVILYFLEFRTLQTHNVKNIIYFLCYSQIFALIGLSIFSFSCPFLSISCMFYEKNLRLLNDGYGILDKQCISIIVYQRSINNFNCEKENNRKVSFKMELLKSGHDCFCSM